MTPRVGCVVMAAGNGVRFGSNKLLAELEGRSLIRRALDAVPAELLRAAGYPANALDDRPFCPKCNDSGWIGTQMCSCLRALCTEEQIKELSKLLDLGEQSFDTFSFDWYSADVWPEYGRSPLENMEMIREICGNYAHTFGPRSGNLLFTGPPGLGKTFLSACIAREVSDLGFSVVYDTAAHVFHQFESEKFGRENPYEEDPDREINRYLNCDLLILDDLGSELTTQFTQSALYELINTRMLCHRPTIYTTNIVDQGVFTTRYTEKVASRMLGNCRIFKFFGQDQRLAGKGRAK